MTAQEQIIRTAGLDVRFYLSEDVGSYVAPHWHDSLEIVYVLEGSLIFLTEEREIALVPDEFHVVNPGTVHAVRTQGNQALVLQIPNEIMKMYFPEIGRYRFSVDMHPESKRRQRELQHMKDLFRQMRRVYDEKPAGYRARFRGLIYELVFALFNSCATETAAASTRGAEKETKLDAMMEYLRDHSQERISVSELAEMYAMDADYMSKLFKRRTGMTIVEYLYAVRVTKIDQAIRETDHKIGEIFVREGCSNLRVATREYKKLFGCTPRQRRSMIAEMR